MTQDQQMSCALLVLAWVWIMYRSRRRICDFLRVLFFAKARAAVPFSMVRLDDDQDQLDPRLVRWLKENCRGAWRFNGNLHLDDRVDMDFWIEFTDIEDSVLFKLTWS